MEESNKLFLFEKKEVILIFLFIALISVISFTLGVRTGKQLSLKQDSYLEEDINNINLKSIDEESVEDVVNPKSSTFENSILDSGEKSSNRDNEIVDTMESRLKEEMEKLANEKIEIGPATTNNTMAIGKSTKTTTIKQEDNFSGKFTIQLFSHQSKESAQDFADSFIVKGYDVIINEVVIPGKGQWYRVGIGMFDNVNDAKEYLEKEKILFQTSKYIIQQI